MQHSTKSAFASGTHANLIVQWEAFILFCLYFDLTFLPVSPLTLRLYAQFLSRSFKSVESIKNYLAGVKTLHALLGFDTSQFTDFTLNLTFRGLARLNPLSVKRAEPITLQILQNIYQLLDFKDNSNIVYWCLFLFAFFLVARKSNLVPSSKKDLECGKFLHKNNVQDCNEFLLVHFTWTKTIQFGERKVTTPLIPLKDKRLCPVTAYQRYKDLNLSHPSGTFFVLPDGNYVSYHMFQKKIMYLYLGFKLRPTVIFNSLLSTWLCHFSISVKYSP